MPAPGPASQGQAEPGPVFLWDFTNWGTHRYPADPPLDDLPLACNPDMLPLPQSTTLGRMAGVGLPVVGRAWGRGSQWGASCVWDSQLVITK